MLITSPLIIRFPRPSILVARRITPSDRIRDLHRTKLRRIGGVRQGEAIDMGVGIRTISICISW
jgi:hypothetical protein